MKAVSDLKYGDSVISAAYDSRSFDVLSPDAESMPLTDAGLGEKLNAPIGSPPLEDIVGPGESVLLVVPDATRQTAAAQVVNLVVRRLIANGTPAHDIRIIFATGIHRRVTDEEKRAIVTPFIAQRIKMLDHDARDLAGSVNLGETSGGIPVELNRAVAEHDHVVLIGGVTFHYFAGFTGGRKLICPGLASSRTITRTHKLAFDCEKGAHRDGVAPGSLDGNPVHEAFIEAVLFAKPAFCISTIVNDRGEAIDLFCGDWIESHRAACDAYARARTVAIPEKRDVVVVSCGGYPFDINMIQAHKALDAAAHACRDGGSIVLAAECRDGLGRDDFLKWFDSYDSNDLACHLCEKYQVNGQTAWSLLRKAERFEVSIVSRLDAGVLKQMRLQKLEPHDLSRICADPHTSGYIIPNGSKISIVTP